GAGERRTGRGGRPLHAVHGAIRLPGRAGRAPARPPALRSGVRAQPPLVGGRPAALPQARLARRVRRGRSAERLPGERFIARHLAGPPGHPANLRFRRRGPRLRALRFRRWRPSRAAARRRRGLAPDAGRGRRRAVVPIPRLPRRRRRRSRAGLAVRRPALGRGLARALGAPQQGAEPRRMPARLRAEPHSLAHGTHRGPLAGSRHRRRCRGVRGGAGVRALRRRQRRSGRPSGALLVRPRPRPDALGALGAHRPRPPPRAGPDGAHHRRVPPLPARRFRRAAGGGLAVGGLPHLDQHGPRRAGRAAGGPALAGARAAL
ncbi:MAG: hypothetical protein AVDCRST_MAG04-2374, partial [uncultured Acetobacteraceae bacterium]